jgi:hypothetical protein
MQSFVFVVPKAGGDNNDKTEIIYQGTVLLWALVVRIVIPVLVSMTDRTTQIVYI